MKVKVLLLFFGFLCIFVPNNVESARRKSTTTTTTPKPQTDFIHSHSDSNQILIGAFNLRKFGLPKLGNEFVFETIVKIITRYDVIALSEITDRTETSLVRLVERVRLVSQRPYRFVVSDRVGRTNNKEQYALIFRSDLLEVKNHFLYNDSTSDPFAREPHIVQATLSGHGKELAIVNIHIKPTDAVAEIDALTDVQSWIEQRLKIKDVIMLGDFNADCGYVAKKAWKNIRLRNMEQFTWLIGDDVDTTVGKTNCAYDRIVTTGSFFKERTLPQTAQAFRFDTLFGLDETRALQVSDHYPVEVVIRPRIRVGVRALSHRSNSSNVFDYEDGGGYSNNSSSSVIISQGDFIGENATLGNSREIEKSSRWTKIIPEWAKRMIKSWF